jgi:protein phosphatase
MAANPEYRYQAASALFLGERNNQEDALATDFAIGGDIGFVVLSDGMGGHNAGDIASKVVVTEVFSELKLQSGDPIGFRNNIATILKDAALSANTCVGEIANGAPAAHGMGATLLVPVFIEDRLSWISVGDSPLYLYRSGHLSQLNEDHSMAPHIDLMVRTGMLSESGGRDHPDRNCLTSVLLGRDIARMDCPETPTQLFDGDIVIAASDGLQYLDKSKIQDVVKSGAEAPSAEIAERLIEEIIALDAADQDNVALSVVKVSKRRSKANWGSTGLTTSRHDFLAGSRGAGRRGGLVAGLRSSLSRLIPSTNGSAQ